MNVLDKIATWVIPLLESPYVVALVLLANRIAVGLVFWRSGQTKVDGFSVTDSTVFLFKYEYNVPYLPPDVAAYMAAGAEHLFPLMLWAGLGGRIGAAGLLALTGVIQFWVYPDNWSEHMLWAAMLAVIVAKGPGLLSLDHLIRIRRLGS